MHSRHNCTEFMHIEISAAPVDLKKGRCFHLYTHSLHTHRTLTHSTLFTNADHIYIPYSASSTTASLQTQCTLEHLCIHYTLLPTHSTLFSLTHIIHHHVQFSLAANTIHARISIHTFNAHSRVTVRCSASHTLFTASVSSMSLLCSTSSPSDPTNMCAR